MSVSLPASAFLWHEQSGSASCESTLIDRPLCFRAVERKCRDLNFEVLAIQCDHPVGAGHESRRGRQRDAAGICKRCSRLEHGLLSDHAGAAHFVRLPDAIGATPVAGVSLKPAVATIADFDRIGPEVTALFGRRAAWPGAR